MSNAEYATENIELSLPTNAAYVSAARLTASSIANRMNFHIDEIEDIKAAVSEACTLFIKKSPPNNKSAFKIVFSLKENHIKIVISGPSELALAHMEDEMGLLMIKALMDSVETNAGKEYFVFTMAKQHKANSFA